MDRNTCGALMAVRVVVVDFNGFDVVAADLEPTNWIGRLRGALGVEALA